MRRIAISGGLVCLLSMAACHLADDADPPKCGPGTHPENDRCVVDAFSGPVITLAAPPGGTLCAGDPATERAPTVTPATVTVKVDGELRFKNEDAITHEIRGADNQVWVTVTPGEHSGFFAIKKAGSWAYRVSACASGGTVVVE